MQTNMEKPIRFAIFGNVYQKEKSVSVQQLLEILEHRKTQIMMDPIFHTYLTKTLHMELPPMEMIREDSLDADIAISMGGDGTFLEAVKRVADRNILILGVNMGRLGFLADIMPDEIPTAFDNVFVGNITTESHSLIRIDTQGDSVMGSPFALNDIAVLKRDNASMISVHITINGEYVGNYLADGIIVATPTGSTAYSLSNGGPIIVPQSNSLCITPVAPHSLSLRPIVIRDDCRIELSVESRTHNFLVAVDGRSQKMHDTTLLTITKARHNIQIVRNPEHHYFSTLREKMMWGADQR